MKVFLSVLIAAVLLPMYGCASLNHAGTASYSVKPFADQNGNVHCCEVTVHNGKEIESLEAHIEKNGDNYVVDLKEKGVKAFAGQRISASAVPSVSNTVEKVLNE
jgi:hypothetical protein